MKGCINLMEENKDSITIGTATNGGALKLYFDKVTAEETIQRAKMLYQKYIEIENIKKKIF